MSFVHFRKSPIALAVGTALLAVVPAVHADSSDPQLEGIVVTGERPATAPYEAPTQGSLDAGEPQSVINQHYIENNLGVGANYTDIINIAPSVSDTTPNGQGNAESLNMSIRGFQDGQFNVTFDGIPWNDSNDFTHHSTSYFTANTLGNVTVDRGPGTASQVGNATFGGTVALESKDPLQQHNVTPSLMIGSFHTNDYSVQVDTGALPGANGGRAMVALTAINSDGAMTNNNLERKNAFVKYVQPVSADTSVTGVVMYNTLHQNVSQFGTTQPQLDQFGSSYSLSENPGSDSYYGFNFDDIHTDFEYLDLKTVLGGWRIDEKAYTYAYYHKINETNDPSLAQGSLGQYIGCSSSRPNATAAQNLADCTAAGAPYSSSAAYVPGSPNYNDVAGQKGFNNYRSWGDVFHADADMGPGTVKTGLWVDYQWNDRALWDVDWTLGGTLIDIPGSPTSVTQTANANANGFQRVQHNTLTTLAPFVEYEYRPIDALTITPGVRYTSFKRTVDAAVNQNSLAPLDYSHTWSSTQPSLYANYKIASNWSAYAQYARGFLAPNLNLVYYASQTAANEFTPENTNNLQAGTTWKSDRLTVSADIYHIKFNNFVTAKHTGGDYLLAVGGGSAVFKGEELEGTYALGAGVSVYANWSHNNATYADGTPVLNTPNGTSAIGLIYDSGPLYGSLTSKRVGAQVEAGGNGPDNGNYDIGAYTVNNLALVYTVANPGAGAKALRLKFNVYNLANNQSRYYVYGGTLAGADEFMDLPGRAYQFAVSADF
jgi:iron complex outermembrane receptor protein